MFKFLSDAAAWAGRRLMEPSTWAGLAAGLVALAPILPAPLDSIAKGLAMVASGLAFALREKGKA